MVFFLRYFLSLEEDILEMSVDRTHIQVWQEFHLLQRHASAYMTETTDVKRLHAMGHMRREGIRAYVIVIC